MRFPLIAMVAAVVALAGAGTVSLRAEEVDVAAVRFSNVRPPQGAAGAWWEAEIALDAKPAGGTRMVGRVRVALLLAFELPAASGASERRLEHYRTEAECVALEPGRAAVRFYLPPELVKRDQLHGEPKYWCVELAIAGRPVAPGRNSQSATLAAPEARKNFQARASTAATANDGLLQPQYLTPFVFEYPRATPSFVRRESR